MSKTRPLYLGPRLRRLRRELGLTQQGMADDLAISPSYIALLERNQRPVTADMLLRLTRTYQLDMAEIAGNEGQNYAERLAEVLRDPIFEDIDLPKLEIADVATSFPGLSEALLRLHQAYVREAQALAEQRVTTAQPDEQDPVREAQRFLAANGNYFHALDTAAERLAEEIAAKGGAERWLADKGVRLRLLPPEILGGSLRRFDRHNQHLLVADTLDRASRAFQIATHIAHTALRAEIRRTTQAHDFASPAAAALTLTALAGYGAAAIVMPYVNFAEAAEQRRYDVEALCALFGASFEQVAHRLTTLQRPGAQGVGFFFLRVDEAGNVSKRLDGANFPFAGHGGGCPLWNLHQAFRRPEEILQQWLELPDGQCFFSLVRTVRSRGLSYGSAGALRAVALGCSSADADRLVYVGAHSARPDPTPIGITCRLCQRSDCLARAAPPIGRDLLSDEYRRGAQPYMFADV